MPREAALPLKTCTKCGETKPLSDFYNHCRMRDGKTSQCKLCVDDYHKSAAGKAVAKKSREAHREERVAACAKWNAEHAYEAQLRYKAKYPGRAQAALAKWREKNRDRIAEYRRQYRIEHREQIQQYQRAWIASNLDRCRVINEARRAREAGAPGEASMEQIQARWDLYGGLCYLCGAPAEAIDHVKPLSKGGANWPCNLRPICRSCNSRKRAAWPMSKVMSRHYGP